jgi:hypothetical protein
MINQELSYLQKALASGCWLLASCFRPGASDQKPGAIELKLLNGKRLVDIACRLLYKRTLAAQDLSLVAGMVL